MFLLYDTKAPINIVTNVRHAWLYEGGDRADEIETNLWWRLWWGQAVSFVFMRFVAVWIQSPRRCLHIWFSS